MPTQDRTPVVFPRISRTIDDIRGGLYARIDAVQDSLAAAGFLPRRLNLNKGIARGLIEIFAWGSWQVYVLLEKLLKQAVPYYSSGAWLDLHAESVGLARKDATRAAGLVRFLRGSASSGNIPIASGRIMRTLPDGTGTVYRYITTENAVLPADADYVDVPAEAEEYGAGANAAVGQICELVTPVSGIAGVTNSADWLTSEGADKEKDAQLQERIRLHWLGLNGCIKYAYMGWALSVPGVISVEILDRHPRGQGTVGVVIRGSAAMPTDALLQRVRDAIAPEAPINDDWYVVSYDPVPVAVTGCLHYVDTDPDQLVSLATARMHALFADKSNYADITPLVIGQDLPLARLTAAVMGTPRLKSVSWPGMTDTVVPKSGLAVLASTTFTILKEDEA